MDILHRKDLDVTMPSEVQTKYAMHFCFFILKLLNNLQKPQHFQGIKQGLTRCIASTSVTFYRGILCFCVQLIQPSDSVRTLAFISKIEF